MTEQFSKEQIIEKARAIAKQIEATEEVAFFKRAETQLDQNVKVQQKIAALKKLQKQAVNLQHYGKVVAHEQAEAQIDTIQQEIDNMPIVEQFKSVHSEVNELLQLITTSLSEQLEKE